MSWRFDGGLSWRVKQSGSSGGPALRWKSDRKKKEKKKRLINGLQMFFNVDLLKYDLMKAWVVTHYYYSQMVQKQCYNVD